MENKYFLPIKVLSQVASTQRVLKSNVVLGWSSFKGWVIKKHMTRKIFSAYMKGLSKYRRMALFFLKYLFSF